MNNNAAAVLLCLAATAAGGEVVISRGELIEIGDGFRIPDILGRSGARLVEVGTTNRTRTADYERALGEDTRAILRVHQSNFRMLGFTERPQLADLAAMVREHDLILIDDLGSGQLIDLPVLADEPTARSAVAAGATLVCFSGDKLLGGPQAGVIVGTAEAVGLVKRIRSPGRFASTSCRWPPWRRRSSSTATHRERSANSGAGDGDRRPGGSARPGGCAGRSP